MKFVTTLCAALLAAPFLSAQQDGAAAPPMGNPKTEAHALLAKLAGNWTIDGYMAAMPGVPGMEQPTRWTGTERAEMVCDGLWLKVLGDSQCGDQRMQGLWLNGYDPKQQKYRGIWVGNMDEPYMECDGSYDAKTRTWTYHGKSPQGAFRSVYALTDADHSLETVYLIGADGKETECMRIERRRVDSAPVDASATGTAPDPVSEHHARLAAAVGDWDLVTAMSVPGKGRIEEPGSERVVPICGGKWFWSDFRGSMMGQPFEGHSLMGYDPQQEKYVGVWIDSSAPTHALTWGTYDAAKRQWTFTGECIDMNGKAAKIHEIYRQPDEDTRDLQMTFVTEDGKQEMSIHYTRKPK